MNSKPEPGKIMPLLRYTPITMQKTTEHVLILTTCPNKEQAIQIAHELVNSKQVACVNIIPKVYSVYSWQGQVQKDAEHLLLIKTKNTFLEQVEQTIKRLHVYELPEVVAVPMSAGSEDYLAWIDHAVQ